MGKKIAYMTVISGPKTCSRMIGLHFLLSSISIHFIDIKQALIRYRFKKKSMKCDIVTWKYIDGSRAVVVWVLTVVLPGGISETH